LPRSSATMLAVIAAIFTLRIQINGVKNQTKKKGQRSPLFFGVETA